MGVEEMSPEEFMAEAGLGASKPAEPKKRASSKTVKRELLEGEIGEVTLTPEIVTQETVRHMKVISITRRPTGRIAEIELRVKDGTLYNVVIDEATTKALAAVFT